MPLKPCLRLPEATKPQTPSGLGLVSVAVLVRAPQRLEPCRTSARGTSVRSSTGAHARGSPQSAPGHASGVQECRDRPTERVRDCPTGALRRRIPGAGHGTRSEAPRRAYRPITMSPWKDAIMFVTTTAVTTRVVGWMTGRVSMGAWSMYAHSRSRPRASHQTRPVLLARPNARLPSGATSSTGACAVVGSVTTTRATRSPQAGRVRDYQHSSGCTRHLRPAVTYSFSRPPAVARRHYASRVICVSCVSQPSSVRASTSR